MCYKKTGQKAQKNMVQPVNLIFRFLQNKLKIQDDQRSRILYENVNKRIEGHIIGFDEYMNLILEDAEEINIKTEERKMLGRIFLKGEDITLLMNTEEPKPSTG